MDFTRNVAYTIRVGDKHATRMFAARYSIAQDEYFVPQKEFLDVAAELGASEGQQFTIEVALN